MTSPICSIDFETRSQVDLPKHGVYKYVEHPTTDVWCMAWAFDYGPVSLWRRGQPIPPEIDEHVRRGGLIRGWNVAFERIVWNGILAKRHGWPALPIEQTWCTQAQALTGGLPAALDKCAEALGVDTRKDQDGRKLMLKMCRPRLVHPDGTLTWWDDEFDQQRLGAYCVQDVVTERGCGARLRPMPDLERAIYVVDQRINDRGMLLDHDLVHAGLTVVGKALMRLDHDVKELTEGLVQNTRQRNRILFWLWLHGDMNEPVDSIDKYALIELLKRNDLTAITRAVLVIRQEAAKSSTAKLTVMQRASNRDGRIRGVLQYYGARQTGRWAGRLLQPQNFPRGSIKPKHLEAAVASVKHADRTLDISMVELWGSALDMVSSLLRACIIAAPGKRLLVADFNAIEARVLAWLATNTTLMNLFRTGGDPYKRMAAKIYDCDLAEINTDQRFMGKTLVLSCGYQCGWRNLQRRVAREGVYLDDDDAREFVDVYRADNPEIVGLWASMDEAAKNAVRNPGTVYKHPTRDIRFGVKGAVLYMKLPSDRFLTYLRPAVETVTIDGDDGPWQTEAITFWGVHPITWQWCKMQTYGGKLVENATQALARDCLAAAILRVERCGYPVVLHVHDEIVAEVDPDDRQLPHFLSLIEQVPEWLGDCPIKVEGWSGQRYRK